MTIPHLGQLLTYAAGLDAITMVWVARPFTDEHRAALDWLNENTREEVNFFGLEIEPGRIGDSPPAPKFNVVSQPNDWSGTARKAAAALADAPLTKTRQIQLAYWTAFVQAAKANPAPLRTQQPLPQSWTTLPLGKTNVSMAATVNTVRKKIGAQVSLAGDDGKAYFQPLFTRKAEIEKASGGELEWRLLPDKQESQIGLTRSNPGPSDRESWPQQHEWLREKLAGLHDAFAPRVKALVATSKSDAAADE